MSNALRFRAGSAWANLPLRGKGLVVVALPLIALLVATAAFAVLQRQLQQVEARVKHTLEVRAELQRVHTILLEEEVAVRARFLNRLQGANLAIAPALDTFRSMTNAMHNLDRLLAGNPAQQRRLARIRRIVDDETAALVAATGEEPGPQLTPEAAARMGRFLTRSRNALTELRQELGFMLYEEDINLAGGVAEAERLRRRIGMTLAGGVVLGLGGGLLGALLFASGIGLRVQRSAENARRLVEGAELLTVAPSGDEVGRLEQSLIETRGLLVQREEAMRGARDDAERANQAKSTFLANVSHELRTPLNAIIGFTRLVLRKSEGQLPALQRENLQKVLVSSEHLLNLINGLLDLSKIEAGRMEVLIEPVDLIEVVKAVVSTVEPALKNGVHLGTDLNPDLPPLMTDREKLTQILLNLVGNAVKFTEAGRITISAQAADGTLQITVSDTGIGIPPDAIAHIFEEFRQVDMSTTKRYGGTGLGLAIVKRFCGLLGGDVTAASEPGGGSTFTVSLPLRPAG